MGPQVIMEKMKSILSHIGAWAPKAEQVASAAFLRNKPAIDQYMVAFKSEVEYRLHAFYEGFTSLKKEGFAVDCIEPMAAIYLTVQFDLKGKTTEDGKLLKTTEDVTAFILDKAKFAIVPFSAFGASSDSSWYRLSVGTCHRDKIPGMLAGIGNALRSLK